MSIHRVAPMFAATLVLVGGCKEKTEPQTSATSVTPAAPTTAASPTKAAAETAVPGIKAEEMVAAVCNMIAKVSECAEFVVTKPEDKAKVMADGKALCPTLDATSTSCPVQKRVGTCRVMKDVINHYYSEGGKSHTLATAKVACEKDHGHWVD